MEKGEYKTGQLLGVVEKRGKLIREYVAGFFGDEPIIKQRLMTPQEIRIYREDEARGISQGKTASEAAKAASQTKPGSAPAGKPGLKKRPVKRGTPVRRRPISARGAQPEGAGEKSAVQARPRRAIAGDESAVQESQPESRAPVTSGTSETNYGSQHSSVNDAFIQQILDSTPEKPDFNPANRQKALTKINRIGCPEMKIFKVGTEKDDKEGYFYSQKEFLVRDIMGLPKWQPKPEEPKKAEETETTATVETEETATETTATVETGEEATVVTTEEDTDAKFDA